MRLFRGWFGEKKTTFNMWLSLNSKTYRRFHNVIIPSKNGTAQIDHLLVSPYGLFIVETKNIKGWIFGSENNQKWTNTVYSNKYQFQNPLKQTYRQKKVLSAFLGMPVSKIHTVIYFVGDCEFKTQMPANVLNSGLGSYIKRFHKPILSPTLLERTIGALQKHKSESSLTTTDHVRSLRQRHNSNSNCPKCGSKLVLRTAAKGPKAGSQFLGCQNFPSCRFTRNV